MEKLESIIYFLIFIAGSGCLAIICISIFKIMVGDEQDSQKYKSRIKNAMIALVLCLTITPIKNLVTNIYFNENELNIGKAPNDMTTSIIKDIIIKDKKDRDTFIHNNEKYVITTKKNLYSADGEFITRIGYARRFGESQGLFDGWGSWTPIYYFTIEDNGNTYIMANTDTFYCNEFEIKVVNQKNYEWEYSRKNKITVEYGTFDYGKSNESNAGGGGAW